MNRRRQLPVMPGQFPPLDLPPISPPTNSLPVAPILPASADRPDHLASHCQGTSHFASDGEGANYNASACQRTQSTVCLPLDTKTPPTLPPHMAMKPNETTYVAPTDAQPGRQGTAVSIEWIAPTNG